MRLKLAMQRVRQQGSPILSAFTVTDKNQLLIEIDVFDSQATAFVDPETTAIDDFQHQADRALGIP